MSSHPTPDETEATLRFELLDARIAAAVQRVAESDPNPTDPFRGLYISDDQALALAAAGTDVGIDERLAAAIELLELDPLDAAVLALCAAPELSPRYGRLFAYLHDDVTKKFATPRLVAQLLSGEGVSPTEILPAFAHDAPLRTKGALRVLAAEPAVPLVERQVKVADQLAAFLVGAEIAELSETGKLRIVPQPAYDPGRSDTVRHLRSLIASGTALPIVVAGPDAAALVSVATQRPVLLADIRDISEQDTMADAQLSCGLNGTQLCFEGLERLEPNDRPAISQTISQRAEPTLIVCSTVAGAVALGDVTVALVQVPFPTFAERKSAWTALSGNPESDDAAAKFRLSVGQIQDAVAIAQMEARSRKEKRTTARDLDLGARRASSSKLGELATSLEASFSWNDLVLPERQRELLTSISAYLRHRDLVLSEWGYEKTVAQTQGLKVLFAGESGTGKTMAAQVVAGDLGLQLFRVDLATIVSKYIGETEKNLDRIFSAAEGSNAILFFDEADALFGKRSEVSDSHDRYANIEVAYLLQKMEQYPGAVILATNFRRNIDDAFVRRLDFVIDFPFPEVEDRKRIWSLLLPADAPLGEDIDIDFLARQFKLSGGSIRNCSLAAAFEAAEEGSEIEMRHLVRGVAQEYGKQGRLTLETDFEHFHDVIRMSSNGENRKTTAARSAKKDK